MEFSKAKPTVLSELLSIKLMNTYVISDRLKLVKLKVGENLSNKQASTLPSIIWSSQHLLLVGIITPLSLNVFILTPSLIVFKFVVF